MRQWRSESQTLRGEEEERAVTPQVARAPKGSPRSTTKPQVSPTPAELSASSLTDLSPPESISGDEDSNGENAFDCLTTTHYSQ